MRLDRYMVECIAHLCLPLSESKWKSLGLRRVQACKEGCRKAFPRGFGLRMLLVLSGLKSGAKLTLISMRWGQALAEFECTCLFSVLCQERFDTAVEISKTTEV